MFRLVVFFCTLLLLTASVPAEAQDRAEVVHWWISGSESDALEVIRDEFESHGNQWIDTPVKASYQAKTAALSRYFSGNPPTVMQWHVGKTIKDLHQEGMLRSIQDIADAEGWRARLPKVIWDYIAIDGQMVVVPITLHASNWIWANKHVLEKLNIQMPATWKEFLSAAPAIKSAGITPIALGGQPWQENLLFGNIALAVGGKDFYRKAFVENNPAALASLKMIEAFKLFAALRPYVDDKSPGRSWDATTHMVISGQAAFQVMGDWAKGEFLKAGMECSIDYLCALAPGTSDSYVVVSDAFAMVAVKDPDAISAQKKLAKVLMDPDVQKRFNLKKGAIPPLLDISADGFDPCAQLALKKIKIPGTIIPGLNMAQREAVASAILSTVSSFWNTPGADPEQTVKKLANAVKESQF